VTGTVTKKTVLAAARKKWTKAQLRENPKALDAEGKMNVREKCTALTTRRQDLEVQRKNLGDTRTALRKAVEFVLDVDDDPSWEQLRIAYAREARFVEIGEELASIREEFTKASAQSYRYRWEIGVIDETIKGTPFLFIRVSADTLEELLMKIETANH
jgi:hypothetical protein